MESLLQNMLKIVFLVCGFSFGVMATGGCPTVYAPVCGADGVTYANSCEARAPIIYRGECDSQPQNVGNLRRMMGHKGRQNRGKSGGMMGMGLPNMGGMMPDMGGMGGMMPDMGGMGGMMPDMGGMMPPKMQSMGMGLPKMGGKGKGGMGNRGEPEYGVQPRWSDSIQPTWSDSAQPRWSDPKKPSWSDPLTEFMPAMKLPWIGSIFR